MSVPKRKQQGWFWNLVFSRGLAGTEFAKIRGLQVCIQTVSAKAFFFWRVLWAY